MEKREMERKTGKDVRGEKDAMGERRAREEGSRPTVVYKHRHL